MVSKLVWGGLLKGVIGIVALGVLNVRAADEKGDSRPNVIFVLADDLGYSDISPYGAEIETPNLQRLAEGGMRFTQMHNTSKCFPSRACLLTGVYAQHASMHDGPGHFHHSVYFGEVLQRAGYRTLFIGKHHSTDNPYKWGFDHYRGLRDGAANYFNPGKKRPSDPGLPAQKRRRQRTFVFDEEVVQPYTPEPGYYSTDTWTDWALELLRQYRKEEKPFALYLAYQAPHDPLQAWPEDIEKYAGMYKKGYSAIREARYRRLIESGLLDEESYPLSAPTHRDWESLSQEEKADQARRMQVYAAMIDRMDQNIGRIIDYLKEHGELENTVFMFASDNGASAEVVRKGKGPIGSMTRWASLGKDWANVGNTPFRYYKNWSYQGGIATPFIVHWPGVVPAGSQTDYVAHFIDLMPTLVEIADAEYPERYKDETVVPMQGKSLLPVLKGKDRRREGPIYWEWRGGKAVYQDGWKIIKQGDRPWELYDLRIDRSETVNLIESHPSLADRLKGEWQTWWENTEAYRQE